MILFSEATIHGALPWRAERQRRLAPDGLSWNVLSGALCLFVANASVVNEVLRRSDGRRFGMVLHPNANIILGRHNIAFLHGAKHKALRASFLDHVARERGKRRETRGDALGAGGNVETPHGYLTLVVAEREGVVRGGDGEPDPP